MFDLPETKRVCRTELFSRPPSPTSASSQPIQQPFEFEFITIDKTPALNASANADEEHREKEKEKGEGEEADSEEFDFPLFTTPKSADGVKKTTTQRITIKSPTPPAPEQDLWEVQAKLQKRSESHYLLSRQEMEKRSVEFKAVVLSGEEVLRGAQVKWHGCLLPWKVTHLVTTTTTPGPTKNPTKKPMIPELSILGVDKKKKHSRPGKKRRIHLRIAAQKLKATEEARQKSLAGREKYKGLTKEERDRVEREEKSKRNREKKIKARQRERAKKEAAAAAAATVVVATKNAEENGGEESVEINGD